MKPLIFLSLVFATACFGAAPTTLKRLSVSGDIDAKTTISGNGVTPFSKTTTRIIIEGDSLSVASVATRWPHYFTNMPIYSGLVFTNSATSGDTIAGITTEYATETAPYYSAAMSNNLLCVWIGANVLNDGTSWSNNWYQLSNYWSVAKATGFKIVAFTILPHVTEFPSAAMDARRNKLNDLIRNANDQWDYLVDVASLPLFANPFNTDVFPDGVHPGAIGGIAIANLVDSTLRAGIQPRHPQVISVQTNKWIAARDGTDVMTLDDSGHLKVANPGGYTGTQFEVVSNTTPIILATNGQVSLGGMPYSSAFRFTVNGLSYLIGNVYFGGSTFPADNVYALGTWDFRWKTIGVSSYITNAGGGAINIGSTNVIVLGGVASVQQRYSTNITTMAADFMLRSSTITTNAAFILLAPLNLSATQYEEAKMFVTNSTASAVAITAPAGWHLQGTWFVTNMTRITVSHYGNIFTNAESLPLF